MAKFPVDVKPEIEAIFKRHEGQFSLDEEVGQRIAGEQGAERAKELKEEFFLLRVYVLGEEDKIEDERINELKVLIENKLALNEKAVGEKTAESRTPNWHRAKIAHLRVRMEGWRQRRLGWTGKSRKKHGESKTLLTRIGLLMEGLR